MALYEVVLRQRYFDQLCINVWNYITLPGIGVTPSALELLTLMGFIPSGDPLAFPDPSIADFLVQIQPDEVSFLSAEARELYSVTDFYEAAYSPPIVGINNATQATTPFNAYGLFTARVRTDIRRGFKRIAGVTEGNVLDGGEVGAEMLAVLTSLADAMSEQLTGATAVYSPAVISREKIVDPETGKVTYQLYEDEAEQEEHTAFPLVWAPYEFIRSQTSRQYGRGT